MKFQTKQKTNSEHKKMEHLVEQQTHSLQLEIGDTHTPTDCSQPGPEIDSNWTKYKGHFNWILIVVISNVYPLCSPRPPSYHFNTKQKEKQIPLPTPPKPPLFLSLCLIRKSQGKSSEFLL